jgi:hypothetical protein
MRPRVLALLALLGACDRDPIPGPVTLDLSFTFAASACVYCTDVDTCPLDCGGEVGLYLIDVDSGHVLDKTCREFVGETGLVLRELPRMLTEARLDEGIVTGHRMRLEVAVFSPKTAEGDCPPIVATTPRPITQAGDLATYYGSSAEFILHDSGSPVSARIDMGCGTDERDCSTRQDESKVTAHVLDVLENIHPPADPLGLNVQFGQLLPSTFKRYHAVRQATLSPHVIGGFETFWDATVQNPVLDGPCLPIMTERTGPGDDFPYLSCDSQLVAVPGNPGLDDVVAVGGYISGSAAKTILNAFGQTGVPTSGMIIGRVTAGGSPIAGALVKPSVGSAQVVYLDNDLKPEPGLTTTASAGWFVVIDPPSLGPSAEACCSRFEASQGGLVGCSRGPMGLVDGYITTGIIDILDDACVDPP